MANTLRDAQLDREASAAAAQATAGWYPDTGGSGRRRYWDGTACTDHFADSAQSSTPADSPASETMRPGNSRQKRAEPGVAVPHGRPVSPWSERLSSHNVVGESFHEVDFKRLAAEHGHKTIPEYGIELAGACAAIVCDPENPYDSNALALCMNGRYHVGHLPRDYQRR